MPLSTSTLNLKFMQRAQALKASSSASTNSQPSTPSSTPLGRKSTPAKDGETGTKSTPTVNVSSPGPLRGIHETPGKALIAEEAAKWFIPRKVDLSNQAGPSTPRNNISNSQVKFETSYMSFLGDDEDDDDEQGEDDEEMNEGMEIEVNKELIENSDITKSGVEIFSKSSSELAGGGRIRFGGFGEPPKPPYEEKGDDDEGEDDEDVDVDLETKDYRQRKAIAEMARKKQRELFIARGGFSSGSGSEGGLSKLIPRKREVDDEDEAEDDGKNEAESSKGVASTLPPARKFLRPGGPLSPPPPPPVNASSSNSKSNTRSKQSSISTTISADKRFKSTPSNTHTTRLSSPNQFTDQSTSKRGSKRPDSDSPSHQSKASDSITNTGTLTNTYPHNEQKKTKISTADKLRQTISNARLTKDSDTSTTATPTTTSSESSKLPSNSASTSTLPSGGIAGSSLDERERQLKAEKKREKKARQKARKSEAGVA